MAETKHVAYGKLEGWASKLDGLNNEMKNELETIQKKITSLNGAAYESNSAVTIREKIQGMTPRFEQYYDVVNNFSKFLRNTAQAYEATEGSLDSNAKNFI